MEVVRELEGQHRIVDLARTDLLDILLRTHPVGVLVIVGDAPPEHDRLQVELLAQLLAVVVHASRQTQPPVFGVDEDLDAVEDVALRIVRAEGFIARNLGVGVVALDHVVIDDDRESTAHDLVVHDRYDLPFGKDLDELVDLLTGPEDILVRIDARKGLGQLSVILHLEIADLDLVDLVHRICHHSQFFRNTAQKYAFILKVVRPDADPRAKRPGNRRRRRCPEPNRFNARMLPGKRKAAAGGDPATAFVGTRSGNRTRTAIAGHRILSPACLPIPPSEPGLPGGKTPAKVRNNLRTAKKARPSAENHASTLRKRSMQAKIASSSSGANQRISASRRNQVICRLA